MYCSITFLILVKFLLNSIPSPLESLKSSKTCLSISISVDLKTNGFLLRSMQEIVTIPGVITFVVYFKVASRAFSSFSVVSRSVVTQNLVILLTNLWRGVWEWLWVAPWVDTNMLSSWAGWVNPWNISAGSWSSSFWQPVASPAWSMSAGWDRDILSHSLLLLLARTRPTSPSLNFFFTQMWFWIWSSLYLLEGRGIRTFLNKERGRLSIFFHGSTLYLPSFQLLYSDWSLVGLSLNVQLIN